MILEICAASAEDCYTAQLGGADRIELNCALELGGLTPTLGTLMESKERIGLPIISMIRPRPGAFRYSAQEFLTMQRDIELMLEHGADGIAFGILTSDGGLDMERCRRVVDQVGDREVVFHRAFDLVPDPFTTLEQLVDLGMRRIMTSGQEPTALSGAEMISVLYEQAAGRIEILPAGGINGETVAALLERTGCRQIHASLSMSQRDPSGKPAGSVKFNSPAIVPEDRFKSTDGDAVRKMRAFLDGYSRQKPLGERNSINRRPTPKVPGGSS